MSVASVHPSISQGYQHDTLDDFNTQYYNEPAVLSIEEIRLQLYSCFTCGVSWLQDHVCLDCAECGGYSLQRPCPVCDGRCASSWKRDLTMSHACGKSRWNGKCQLENSDSVPSKSMTKEEEIRVCSNLNNVSQRS